METRTLRYQHQFTGFDRGENTNFFTLKCWEYLQDDYNVYWEAQRWVDGVWTTKLLYSEKKVVQYYKDFIHLDRALPVYVKRVLYIPSLGQIGQEPPPLSHDQWNNEIHSLLEILHVSD